MNGAERTTIPQQIADLPDTFQRMYIAAPAELVPLSWVAQQAGFRNVGTIHNKIGNGTGPRSFISGKRRVCDRVDAVTWIAGQCRDNFRQKAGQ